MFNDPLSITVATVATDLPRVSLKEGAAVYRSPDGLTKLTVSHQSSKSRVRSLIRIDILKTLYSVVIGANAPFNCSAYVVIDTPTREAAIITQAQKSEIVTDLLTWLTANSGANLTKVVGSEI